MIPTDPTTTHSTDSSNFYNVTAGGDHMPRRAGLPVEHAARAGEPLAPERAGPGVAGRAGQGVRDGAGLPPPPPPFDARIFAARASRRDDEPRPVKLISPPETAALDLSAPSVVHPLLSILDQMVPVISLGLNEEEERITPS
jgi:hypothetical protein